MTRRSWTSAAALAAYLLVSFLAFGVRLLPHPGRGLVGSGLDPEIFVWSFAWWPHAILHGENPFVSAAVWAPDGANLAWVTSVPALSLAFAPLTLLAGPAAAYNVAAVALPALAAWTAFLLCRHLTRRFWPSAAGGYLFGFSSYMLGQQFGHMNLTAVFVLPLVALVVVRFVEGTLDGRGLAWRLGLLLGLQAYLSTELLLTTTVALAAALLLALWVVPTARPRLRTIAAPVAAAAGIAVVVAAPLLWYALTDFRNTSLNDPNAFSADLLNLVVPTQATWLGGGWLDGVSTRFPGNLDERGAYLGLPTLAIVVWLVIAGRRRPAVRFLAAAAALAAFAALGTALWVGGHRVVWLPWDLAARLPLLNHVLPARFAVFVSLAAAVGVALWAAADAPARWVRVVLTVAAVLAVAPAVQRPWWIAHPQRPELFAHPSLVKSCLARGENVLIQPYGTRGDAMLWQAENDFWFRMAGGYTGPQTPASFAYFPAAQKALAGVAASTDETFLFMHAKGVARILSVTSIVPPDAESLKQIGPLQELGGVYVAPACGYRGIAG